MSKRRLDNIVGADRCVCPLFLPVLFLFYGHGCRVPTRREKEKNNCSSAREELARSD